MDKYGICTLAQVPMRETVSHSSSMVSQLLFGDTFKIEDKFKNWLKIETDYDNYSGWVDKRQVTLLSSEAYSILKKDKTTILTADTYAKIERTSDCATFYVGMGCRLPQFEGSKFKIGDNHYTYNGSTIDLKKTDKIDSFLDKNYSNLLNIPYIWGGRSTFGLDCSGFTQLVFKCCANKIKRDASQQAEVGETIIFLEEAVLGDLVFFDNEDGAITHVGIYLGNNKVLHSSAYVRIDFIDHEGILNEEKTAYTHKLRLIKRILTNSKS